MVAAEAAAASLQRVLRARVWGRVRAGRGRLGARLAVVGMGMRMEGVGRVGLGEMVEGVVMEGMAVAVGVGGVVEGELRGGLERREWCGVGRGLEYGLDWRGSGVCRC